MEVCLPKSLLKNNFSGFTSDFMFQLIDEEWDGLRLQFETSKKGLEYLNLKQLLLIQKQIDDIIGC